MHLFVSVFREEYTTLQYSVVVSELWSEFTLSSLQTTTDMSGSETKYV